MSTLKFTRIRLVASPRRGTDKSAGIDFFIPDFETTFIKAFEDKNPGISPIVINTMRVGAYIPINPSQRVLIPSGIKVNMEPGRALIAHNKSGVSTKLGLDVLACVVDEDYQGEIHISLVNTSDQTVKIFPDEKIVQFLEIPVYYSNMEEVTIENLYSTPTKRGEGGFGSTGS